MEETRAILLNNAYWRSRLKSATTLVSSHDVVIPRNLGFARWEKGAGLIIIVKLGLLTRVKPAARL